jgi:saccharopine dehydrogenase-like NADP-dependent oxidoreductase
LQSLFYGLEQDTLVRGATIDQDRYWYEFLTPIAKIRVDGSMAGPDGNLTLTEIITYNFHWLLLPLFWLLKPFFRRQKEDILFDDSRLLERVYQLDQTDFERQEPYKPRIVVYGGCGFFGRLLVDDLLKYSNAEIIIASKNPRFINFRSYENRVKFVISNINEYESVLATIDGAKVAICCVGPFQGLTVNLLLACIEKKVHYIDVADDRDFIERCHSLAQQVEQAGIMAFVGCSVVPGISSLLSKFCLDKIGDIQKTRIFITPGTRHPRGPGSFDCLLSTVGQQYSVPLEGQQKMVSGWTGRERVDFPPLGARWVYFVVDIADYFLQRIYFRVQTVEFKIGSELDLLNRSLSALRSVKGFLGLKRLNWIMPLTRTLIYLASWFGTSQGAIMVEVSGEGKTGVQKMSLTVFAERQGEVIPSILASIAAQKILDGKVGYSGIVRLPDWLAKDKFIAELSKRQVQLAVKESDSDEWTLYSK